MKTIILKTFKNVRIVARLLDGFSAMKGNTYYAYIEQNIPDSLGNDSWRHVDLDPSIIDELAQPYFDSLNNDRP